MLQFTCTRLRLICNRSNSQRRYDEESGVPQKDLFPHPEFWMERFYKWDSQTKKPYPLRLGDNDELDTTVVDDKHLIQSTYGLLQIVEL